MTWLNKIFETRNRAGKPNGRIIQVWSYSDLLYHPRQVYVSTLVRGETKGPHLHRMRDSLFCCIKGSVVISWRRSGEAGVAYSSEENPVAVHVPAGTAAKIINLHDGESYVLNCSSAIYDATDEHHCEDWEIPMMPAVR